MVFASHTLIRRSVDVVVLTHEELKFGEFNRILPSPTSLHVLRLEPLKGYALLALPGNLIFTMIDIFFGGTAPRSMRMSSASSH